MEFKILNVSAVRTIPTASHFTAVGRGHGYGANLQAFPGERLIRSMAYSIPAVSHHYGNAFAPDGEEDLEEETADTEEEGCTQQMSFAVADTSDGEYNYEEAEADVEMSPAIEVISIDPNCDYDSEEETDGTRCGLVIEHCLDQSSVVVGETVVEDVHEVHDDIETEVIKALENNDIEPELENLHRDSDGEDSDSSSSSESSTSSSSSSDSSDSSDSDSSSSNSNDSGNSKRSRSSASSSENESTSTACSPLCVRHSDHEDGSATHKDNLQRILERRKLMAKERVKRRNSTNRKSFSLPQSPVAPVGTIGWAHDVTSLSFEDLDVSAIVNELSPLKVPVHGCASDDKLIEEMANSNFDLASYITENNNLSPVSKSKSNMARVKPKPQPEISPVKKQLKSRGKQIKMLRELMISPRSSTFDSGGTRRSCTSKARRIVENSDSETEQSEPEADSRDCSKIFGIEQLAGRSKRKEDDTKADPTWNPNHVGSGKPAHRLPIQAHKPTVSAEAVASEALQSKPESNELKPQPVPVIKSSESTKQPSSSNSKPKTLSAGSQLARNKVLSLMAKSKLPRHTVKQKPSNSIEPKSNQASSKADKSSAIAQPKKKPQFTANIKFDHDYCSPKRKLTASSSAISAPQRKAIEIPFLLPTMEQLKRKKKQSKVVSKRSQEEVDKKHNKTGKNCDKKSSQNMVVVDKISLPKQEQVAEKIEEPSSGLNGTKPIRIPQQPPKQVSLLKVNQNKFNGELTDEAPNLPFNENAKSETLPTIAPSSVATESLVKIKKKLNLQEYKKRRELPAQQEGALSSVAATESSSSISSSSVTSISISSSKDELISPVAPTGNDQLQLSETGARSRALLDPISAAKLKALRMQQLKKEAAIKSTEAKTIPKTVPTIVPLAEITSIKFDEHGNPVPYDKHAEKNASGAHALHADYEEIIIVSMGCNTDVTIDPRDTRRETVKIKNTSTEQPEKSIAKSELLSNITDTIKRCQSSGPSVISSSSLISSIHEMVIKKKSSDKLLITGGQASQQGSPNIGGSPPTAFSPGKPEKAGGSYEQQQSPSFDYDETQLRQTAPASKDKPIEHGEDKIIMHLRKDRQRAKGVSVAVQTLPLDRFSELKTLSPLKKQEKPRTVSRSSCASEQRSRSRQMEERDRSRRQYRRRCSRGSSCETETRNRSASSYRSRSKRSLSRRSRSRCSSSRRRSRSCSRSGHRSKRRSHSRSYRCHNSVSSERRSHYSRRDRCRRDRRARRHSSRSESSSCSDSSCSSYSRSRSRSTRSRSSSRSSSRARRMQPQRNDYRRPAVSPERKIVYVGRLEPALKRDDLKRKFMHFGRIKQVTLHFKESGAKYGFVTFEKPQDAYRAIDASGSDPNLCGYDVSFGGRRAFCRTEYADLDGDLSQDQEPIPYLTPDGALLLTPNPLTVLPHKNEPETFEDMLKKLKKEIIAKKPRKS